MQRQRHGAGVELDGLIEGDDEAGDARALRAGQAGDVAVDGDGRDRRADRREDVGRSLVGVRRVVRGGADDHGAPRDRYSRAKAVVAGGRRIGQRMEQVSRRGAEYIGLAAIGRSRVVSGCSDDGHAARHRDRIAEEIAGRGRGVGDRGQQCPRRRAEGIGLSAVRRTLVVVGARTDDNGVAGDGHGVAEGVAVVRSGVIERGEQLFRRRIEDVGPAIRAAAQNVAGCATTSVLPRRHGKAKNIVRAGGRRTIDRGGQIASRGIEDKDLADARRREAADSDRVSRDRATVSPKRAMASGAGLARVAISALRSLR